MSSSSNRDIILAFDLYGTLLSTASIAGRLARYVGLEKAQDIAASWRKYQLEYTWRLNSMGQFEPFSAMTLRSLRHALEEAGESLGETALAELMEAYDSLQTFPDVPPALERLARMPGIKALVFSNGTQGMVENSVRRSPDLGPHSRLFQDIVVVEGSRRFKPAPEVYHMLGERLGKAKTEMGDVWLVSSNPFDVVGARAVGMKAAWVDRSGRGWQDQLIEGDAGRPSAIVKSLEELVDVVQRDAGE